MDGKWASLTEREDLVLVDTNLVKTTDGLSYLITGESEKYIAPVSKLADYISSVHICIFMKRKLGAHTVSDVVPRNIPFKTRDVD